MNAPVYRRNAALAIEEALADTPVVFINGARQTGKSTLARQAAAALPDGEYFTFDDQATLALASADPDGFLARLPRHAVIDEVQRLPELFVAMKAAVDRDRVPGRFLLTGSANVFLLPRLSESLAGRMEVVHLWPFSQGELRGVREGFIDAVFSASELDVTRSTVGRGELFSAVLAGGYPAALARPSGRRRDAWFAAYVEQLLQRDVRDLANVEDLGALPRILELFATRSGNLLNYAEVSRATGTPITTLRRYTTLLRAIFVIDELRAWSANLGRRIIRTPKMYVQDTGLLAHLLDTGTERGAFERNVAGQLLETFVLAELRKQAGWSDIRPRFSFFRDHSGTEVDIVLDARGGGVVGIEVKATASPSARMFHGLEALREALGEKFVLGILLYTGEVAAPAGDRLWALPVSSLWTLGAAPQAPGNG
jgi:hypothetical protein